MSDETTNNAPPVEGTAPAPAAQPETFTREDVEKIIAAREAERAASDPVARFKSTVTKQPTTPQPAQASRLESMIEGLLALQVAAMKPPAPPAPPKQMTPHEKIASVDPEVFLRRGPNAWTQADTSALAADIARTAGVSAAEATARARRQIVERAREVAGHVRIDVRGGK